MQRSGEVDKEVDQKCKEKYDDDDDEEKQKRLWVNERCSFTP